MRRGIVFAALCLAATSASADSPGMFLHGLNELKPQYRQCLSRYDCTYIHESCGGYLAVNTQSKARAQMAALTENPADGCAPGVKAGTAPAVDCVDTLCRLDSASGN